MRVFLVGSIPGHRPRENQEISAENGPLFDAAVHLGWALASKGHRAIVGSASQRTIDPYIVAGYIQYANEHPQTNVHIELQYPSSDNEPTYGEAPQNLHYLHIENPADESSPHRWTISHFMALRSAQLLITMAGGVGSRILGSYAVSNQIPVLAVRDYGGSSAEVFRLARHTYRTAIPRLTLTPTRENAIRLVEFGERLVSSTAKEVPSYFLSYSWADCSIADLTELLLRRYQRMIFRDEDQVRVGLQLPNQLEASIQESDTFLALWSSAYKASAWCPSELEFAIDSQAKTGRPARIVLIELDDTTPSLRATSLLRIRGNERDTIELGVRRLIDQETPT
jgi:TIR domain